MQVHARGTRDGVTGLMLEAFLGEFLPGLPPLHNILADQVLLLLRIVLMCKSYGNLSCPMGAPVWRTPPHGDGGGKGFWSLHPVLHDKRSIETRILSAQTRPIFKGAQPAI